MSFEREFTVTDSIQVKPLKVPHVPPARLGAVQVEVSCNPAAVCVVPSPLRQIHMRDVEEALTAIAFNLRLAAFGFGDVTEFGLSLLRAHLFQSGLFGGG